MPPNPPPPGVALQLDPEALRLLVELVVTQVLARLEGERATFGDHRICYSEGEAAGLMGLEPHQLRDERRRGRITASQIVGRRIRYLREDVVRYLLARRINGE